MTIKDAFETEGLTTTSGAPELADHVPARRRRCRGAAQGGRRHRVRQDEPAALRRRHADLQRALRRCTNNPVGPDRAPGGSSGGAAAALATGMTLLELGSDIGGSIRNPVALLRRLRSQADLGRGAPARPHPRTAGDRGSPPTSTWWAPWAGRWPDLMLGLDVLVGRRRSACPAAAAPGSAPSGVGRRPAGRCLAGGPVGPHRPARARSSRSGGRPPSTAAGATVVDERAAADRRSRSSTSST